MNNGFTCSCYGFMINYKTLSLLWCRLFGFRTCLMFLLHVLLSPLLFCSQVWPRVFLMQLSQVDTLIFAEFFNLFICICSSVKLWRLMLSIANVHTLLTVFIDLPISIHIHYFIKHERNFIATYLQYQCIPQNISCL